MQRRTFNRVFLRFLGLSVAGLCLGTSPLLHAAPTEAAVTAENPYVRLVPPGVKTSAAFLTLKNGSDSPRKLVKAASPVAATVELHTHIHDNGVMRMRPVADIEVPAKGSTVLQPGGLHIMLIDLQQALQEDAKVPLTLSFDDGSTVQVEAPVRKAQAAAPAAEEHNHMHH